MAAGREILVIGNGFDLCHGLQTGYMDFIRRVESAFAKERDARETLDTKLTELCNVNGFFRHFHFLMAEEDSWTYFEHEMECMAEALVRFQDVVEEKQRDPEFDLIEFNAIAGIFTYQELQIFKHFARIFEQIVDDPSGGLFKLRQLYITQDRTLNRRALIDEVRKELDAFTEAFDLYLTECVEGTDCALQIPALSEHLPDYVINFNCTDTVGRYGVPPAHIFDAKGRAGSRPVNLILGCPGSGGLPVDWLPLENDFQKLSKCIGLPDQAQLHPVDEIGAPLPVTVTCFGYSFPEGDAELITTLWDAAEKMVICCTDREDYARKMIALIRLFGKETVTEAIYRGKLEWEVGDEDFEKRRTDLV